MSRPLRVCLLGFNAFETEAIGSALRLSPARQPPYLPVPGIEDAELVVVDADQTDSLATMVRLGRLEQAVFVGSESPRGAEGWLARPLDPIRLMRELDRLAFSLGLAPARTAEVPSSSPGTLSRPGSLRPSARTPPEPPSGWARALLVGSSDAALHFLDLRLQAEGLHTERAAHSGQALQMIASRGYEFVFVDGDPGARNEFDALALCQQLKRQPRARDHGPDPVVVVVSAQPAELDRARAALAGCDGYLAKPLDAEHLHKLLHQHRA